VILDWKGRAADGTEATGKLTIPEVSHEVTLDGLSDYVVGVALHNLGINAKPKKYQWTVTSPSSPATTSLFALAKEKLPTALETKFAAFPADLIDTHGKDIIVGSNEPSRTGSPAPPSSTAVPASALGSAKKATSQKINVSVVEVEATFRASGDDLFSLLTDEKRIPTWSRAPAKVTSGHTCASTNADGNCRAQLRRVQSSSCLAVACGANTSYLLPERRLSRPGHCKVRPGRVVGCHITGWSRLTVAPCWPCRARGNANDDT
jgi:activator of HSP90 ATPase